jgi:hypothetical protein
MAHLLTIDVEKRDLIRIDIDWGSAGGSSPEANMIACLFKSFKS